jgi:hypothetical protein
MEYSKRRKDESREALKYALAEAEGKYRTGCLEHELRIQEMNRSHAEQCEQLCREVIQANRETIRLRKKIAELSSVTGLQSGVGVDRGQYASSSYDGASYLLPQGLSNKLIARKSARKRRGIVLLAAILFLIFGFMQSGYFEINKTKGPLVVWKNIETITLELLKPFVSLAFIPPASKLEIAPSKRVASSRVSVGPMLEARVHEVKHNSRISYRSSRSAKGPSKKEIIANQVQSPLLKLKSRIRRLFRFLKEIIQRLAVKRQGRETMLR